MIVSGGINRIAKSLTGVETDPMAGLNHLQELARQKNAEDSYGATTAFSGILIIAICISCFAYSFTMQLFPGVLKQYYEKREKELSDYYNPNASKNAKKAANDLFDILMRCIKYIPLGAGTIGGSILYIKKRQRAARQRAMEIAMEEEMKRLKDNIQKEADEISAGGVTDNKPSSFLSGASIVELFNSFAAIMGLKKADLRREEEETALEYFMRIAISVNFSKEESIKAARYFDDELYAKKTSSKEDRAAFMKLVLRMLDCIDAKTSKSKA